LGREFSYDLIHAVAPMEEPTLQQALTRLVEAELLHQRGFPPQARYIFKHALIQDAAYQSLLRRTRRRYHGEIAQVLEQRFPELRETQPELMAHHYTQAGLSAQAIAYRKQAAQRALDRSVPLDAIAHAQAGLQALDALTDAPERHQHELTLQTTLGVALTYTRGYGAPEVVRAFERARKLSEQVGDIPQLFTVLRGVWLIFLMRGDLPTASELGDQLLRLAQDHDDSDLLLEAHRAAGTSLFFLGKQTDVVPHLKHGLALHDMQQHRALSIQYGQGTDIMFLFYSALSLWLRGYPDQALQTVNQMLKRSQQRTPYHRSHALLMSAFVHQWRGELPLVHERIEASAALAQEHAFPTVLAIAKTFQGWVLTRQGLHQEGIALIRQGIADYRAMGAELIRPFMLALLAEGYHEAGNVDAGLHALTEAHVIVDKNGERWWEAELYRLKAELLLQQTVPDVTQADVALQQALTVARAQEVKSLELRAAVSLCRLWRQQAKGRQARDRLKELDHWFSEGYDTADLKEAKSLLNTVA
jgi:predicted ATPase